MTDSLPKERLDELDELADAATPGPWEVHETNEFSTLRFMRPYPEWTSPTGGHLHLSMGAENAAFIAAADPDTVRALIAMARRAPEKSVTVIPTTHATLSQPGAVFCCDPDDGQRADDAALASQRTEEAEVKLEQVRALHHPVNIEPSETICAECSNQMPNGRYLPTTEWPCPTVDILDQTKEGEQ